MSTHGKQQSSTTRKTATAAADPVLVRLATKRGPFVLLAEDLTYDKAGTMCFHQIRWVRARRGIRAFLSLRSEPAGGRRAQVIFRKVGGSIMGVIPSEGWLHGPATGGGFAMITLTAEQHRIYRAGSRRRLLQAGIALAPRPGRLRPAAALVAAYRVRNLLGNAFRRALVPLVGA